MCLNPSFHLKLLLPEPHTSGSPSIPEPEGKQMSWGGRSRHIQQEISGPEGPPAANGTDSSSDLIVLFKYDLCVP